MKADRDEPAADNLLQQTSGYVHDDVVVNQAAGLLVGLHDLSIDDALQSLERRASADDCTPADAARSILEEHRTRLQS